MVCPLSSPSLSGACGTSSGSLILLTSGDYGTQLLTRPNRNHDGEDSRASYLVVCSRLFVYKRQSRCPVLVLFFTQQFDICASPTLKFPLGEFPAMPR